MKEGVEKFPACAVCGAPANVHESHLVSGDKTGEKPFERHLCSRCAGIPEADAKTREKLEQLLREELKKRSGQTVTSSRAPEPVGAYPHAKRVGNLLFLSGLGPRKRGSREIPGVTMGADGRVASHDIAEQCRAVFENVRLVLGEAGAGWEDIVDVTVFLTDMKGDFPIFNRLYAEAFAGPGKPNPTRTTVEVTSLPTPIAIELKVIAAI